MNSPARRVVILGASNVVRCLPTVIETACSHWGRPLEIMAAIGHGRSYGMTTTVMGRTLPGILQCDLWHEWLGRNHLPTAALITDIGNDVLFGAGPQQIAAWVRQCLESLVERSERLVITELPLDSVSTIGPRRFLFLRSMLFPRSRLSWDEAISRGQELNGLILELAREFQATVVKPKRDWYGFDPIHIVRRRQKDAWQDILAGWSLSEPCNAIGDQRSGPWWQFARPKYRELFGIVQRCQQPAICASDGTSLSVY